MATDDTKPKFSFGIISSRQFFEKMLAEFDDFDKNPISGRFAINCAINSWHLTDWTFNEYFKNDSKYCDKEKEKTKKGKLYCLIIPGLRIYQDELKKKCPELKYMEEICNGSKHCILRNCEIKDKTIIHKGGYNALQYNRKHYDADRLQIIDKKNNKLNFEDLFEKTVLFWRDYLNELEKN